MSTATQALVKETITISAVGKFGPKVGEVWYGVNKPLSVDDFKQGMSYDVLVRVSGPSEKNPAGGKRYIAQIVGGTSSQQAQATNILQTAAPLPAEKPSPEKTVPSYKPRDFDAEARGKTRCVQFEAALMSPSLAGLQLDTVEKIIKAAAELADAGVNYTFQK